MITFEEWREENGGKILSEAKKHEDAEEKDKGREIHHKLENKVHDLLKDKKCLDKAAVSTLNNLSYWLEKTLKKMDEEGILSNSDLAAFARHVRRAKHDADTIKTTVSSHEHTVAKRKVMKLLRRLAK